METFSLYCTTFQLTCGGDGWSTSIYRRCWHHGVTRAFYIAKHKGFIRLRPRRLILTKPNSCKFAILERRRGACPMQDTVRQRLCPTTSSSPPACSGPGTAVSCLLT